MSENDYRQPLNIINIFSGSLYCSYAFQLDTYLDGCSHECAYCYARDEGLRVDHWNNPSPKAVDLEPIRQLFHQVFETDRPNRWRWILERRIPVRLGGYTDCMMEMETNKRVTLELVRLLNHYNYPHVMVTRSDLASREPYIAELNPKLAAIQLTIPSLNQEAVGKLEPGAPSIQRRFDALKRLSQAGFYCGVRVNPLFPMYADGHFSGGGDLTSPPALDVFDFAIADEAAKAGANYIVAGFLHLSPSSLSQVEAALGVDLEGLLSAQIRAMQKGFFYSSQEIRRYYDILRQRCRDLGIGFTTCYLGYGESSYWKYQDLWSHESDCCHICGNIEGFDATAAQIPLSKRLNASHTPAGWWNKRMRHLSLKLLDTLARGLGKEKSS